MDRNRFRLRAASALFPLLSSSLSLGCELNRRGQGQEIMEVDSQVAIDTGTPDAADAQTDTGSALHCPETLSRCDGDVLLTCKNSLEFAETCASGCIGEASFSDQAHCRDILPSNLSWQDWRLTKDTTALVVPVGQIWELDSENGLLCRGAYVSACEPVNVLRSNVLGLESTQTGTFRVEHRGNATVVAVASIDIRGTLRLRGPRPLIFLSAGDVSISGSLAAGGNQNRPGPGGGRGGNPDPAVGAAGGGRGGGGGGVSWPGTGADGGGGGGGYATGGGAGGAGVDLGANGGGGMAGNSYGSPELVPLWGGSGGGGGGDEAGGVGGHGGGAIQITSRGRIEITGIVDASGGGGSAGTDNESTLGGGGGGGSGGAILLEAPVLTVSANGLIGVMGGAGAQGCINASGDCAAEAGASGDIRSLRAQNLSFAQGSASEGKGGGGGAGAELGAGLAGSSRQNGGGGGGGLGRIRLNAFTLQINNNSTWPSCSISNGAWCSGSTAPMEP